MAEKQKILIVDDKQENLFALRQILDEVDADVVEFTNGNDALIATLEHDFSMAILDVRMPDMDGYELAENLRGDERTRMLPIVFLTASDANEELIFKGYDVGGVDYIVKPYAPEVLLGKVRVFLEMDRDKRELRRHRDELEVLVEERIQQHHELEEKLRQAQKLEGIGRLAGGVAHDFNNLIMAILGNCELMSEGLKDDDPLSENLEHVRDCAKRAALLTRQLLAFSRKQPLDPVVLDVNQVLSGMEHMLRGIIGDDIIIVTSYAKRLGHVKVDANQLEQVFMNLLVNARDAMPDGGTVSIETSNVEVDETEAVDAVGMKPGPHVMIEVIDTGCGMDSETQERIFEPFFTTKSVGEGTGLGLSTIYGIIMQSGGNIQVHSKLGGGTTFNIYLPRDAAELTPALTESRPKPKRVAGAGEHLLVVEDEEAIRTMLEAMLQGLHYKVTVAADGDEALHLVEDEDLKPDLMISDIMMPGMNGSVLADRLRRINPELKVLFMSGYSEEAIVRKGVIEPGTPLLQKPFNLSSLGEKISTMLHTH